MVKKIFAAVLSLVFVALAFGSLFLPALSVKGGGSQSVQDMVGDAQQDAEKAVQEALNSWNGETEGTGVITSIEALLSDVIETAKKGSLSVYKIRTILSHVDENALENASKVTSLIGADDVTFSLKAVKAVIIAVKVLTIVTLLAVVFAVISALTGVGNAGRPMCLMMFIWLGLVIAGMVMINNMKYNFLVTLNLTPWLIVGTAASIFAVICAKERRG